MRSVGQGVASVVSLSSTFRSLLRDHPALGPAVVTLGILAALLAPCSARHARAVGLLVRFAKPAQPGVVGAIGRHDVSTADVSFAAPRGQVPGRIYLPAGVSHPPGLVIAHGVHRLGIEEPRLTSFSRAVASAGIAVLTPEVSELAGFRIAPEAIGTIGAAARDLHHRLGSRVGVLGLSFAGGLSIMAACDDSWSKDMSFVVSVGGHDDLGRVLRFFATNEIELPDGSSRHFTAHDYGPLVLVYGSIDRFFPPEDVIVAREALKYWLWEQFDVAKEKARGLSPRSRERMQALFDHKLETIRPELEAEIEQQRPRFPEVSPSSCVAGVHMPIFLLHGEGDTVIPSSETLWTAQHAAPPWLQESLVSRAVSHVELHGEPGLMDMGRLIHFMARMLEATES